MKRHFYLCLMIIALITLLSGHQPVQPKILIIGDSISIGYTPFVQEKLKGKAEVMHNPGNAQHTGTGLKKIAEWLGEEEWDIIQFNWGLWDLCYRHPDSKHYGNRDKVKGTLTHTVEAYAANLDSLVVILKELTDARLVFLTTSYVPEAEAGRYSEDVLRYNAAAIKVMEKHAVPVRDIYNTSKKLHQKHGRAPDDVHFMEEGYEKLSRSIAKFLHKELRALQRK